MGLGQTNREMLRQMQGAVPGVAPSSEAVILSPEEQPATGEAFSGPTVFDRLKEFANRPAQAAVPSIGGYKSDSEAGAAGTAAYHASRGTPAPAAASTTGSAVAQPVGIEYKPIKTTNPETEFDPDTMFLSAYATSRAIRGDMKGAADARDAFASLNVARASNLAQKAQRGLLAGDVTGAVEVFNHFAPNGRQIVGIGKKDENTFSFKLDDGTTVDDTASGISNRLAAIQKPEIMGDMLKKKAEISAQEKAKMNELQFGKVADFQKMIAQENLQHQSRAMLAEAARSGHIPTVHDAPLGSTAGRTWIVGNRAFEEKMVADPVNKGKMIKELVPVPFPANLQQGAPAQQGTAPRAGISPITADYIRSVTAGG